VGEADVEMGFTSVENLFFVLHDSKGFEAEYNFEGVSKFVKQRRDNNLPLKDRLHAVW
jgi:hypothetical protein